MQYGLQVQKYIYIFSWASNADAWNIPYEKLEWNLYHEHDQNILDVKYKEFLNGANSGKVDLTRAKDYFVDFNTLIQYHVSDNKKMRPIKKDKQPQENIKLPKVETIFYWDALLNPWKSTEKSLWCPYDIEDQVIINEGLFYFTKNRVLDKVKLKVVNNYSISFSKMLQYNNLNPDRIRAVQMTKTFPRCNTVNVKFGNEQYEDPEILSNYILPKQELDLEYFKDLLNNNKTLSKIIKSFKNIYFDIFPEFKTTLMVEDSIYLFEEKDALQTNNIQNTNSIKHLNIQYNELNDFLKILSNEIEELGKSLNYANSITKYREELNSIGDSEAFYKCILRIFCLPGFIRKKINENLRDPTLRNLKVLENFYAALLSSFEFFDQTCYLNKLDDNKNLTVYRTTKVTEKAFGEYSLCDNKNIIRYFPDYQFVSISKEKMLVYPYFSKHDASVEYLWEITIPENLIKSEGRNIIDISNISIFDGEDFLIKNGAVVHIQEITPYIEGQKTLLNKFRCICTLQSFSFAYLSSYIYLSPNIQTLDLTNMGLGNNFIAFNLLNCVLFNNENIQELNLSGNNIGASELDMKMISEALISNRSITSLKLFNNQIGKNKTDMYYMKNILLKNKTISFLDLFLNLIGSNTSDMEELKEALKFNKIITELYLSNNLIGNNFLDSSNLKDILSANETIKSLDISDNKIGSHPHDTYNINQILLKSKNIKQLNLFNNPLENNHNHVICLEETAKLNIALSEFNIKNKLKIQKELENNKIKLQISFKKFKGDVKDKFFNKLLDQ